MNHTEILKWLSLELSYLNHIGAYRVHLCIFKKHLCINQMNHTTNPHPILYVFTRDQLSKGLIGEEWDKLLRVVLKNIKEYPIWKNPANVQYQHSQNPSDV